MMIERDDERFASLRARAARLGVSILPMLGAEVGYVLAPAAALRFERDLDEVERLVQRLEAFATIWGGGPWEGLAR